MRKCVGLADCDSNYQRDMEARDRHNNSGTEHPGVESLCRVASYLQSVLGVKRILPVDSQTNTGQSGRCRLLGPAAKSHSDW